MMKILLTLLLSITAFALHAADENKAQKFSIYETEYMFSNYFEFTDDINPAGIVTKKRFAYGNLTNRYDVYDKEGDFVAYGKTRLFCLGAFFSWGTEIDIYNADRSYLGMIDGQIATTATARFSIYQKDSESGKTKLVGIAYMDDEKRSFSIFDPKNDKKRIATLRRILRPHERDYWECHVFKKDAIDTKIIQIFATFAADHQEYFRVDN